MLKRHLYSQTVTHIFINQALRCLTSRIERGFYRLLGIFNICRLFLLLYNDIFARDQIPVPPEPGAPASQKSPPSLCVKYISYIRQYPLTSLQSLQFIFLVLVNRSLTIFKVGKIRKLVNFVL